MILPQPRFFSAAPHVGALTTLLLRGWSNLTAATILPRTVQLWGLTTAIAVPSKMEGS
jgi:hypothetical protein